MFEIPLEVSAGDGINYPGKITLIEEGSFYFYIYNVKNLKIKLDMVACEKKSEIPKIIAETFNGTPSKSLPNILRVKGHIGELKSLKGKLIISFEPNNEKIMEEKIVNYFTLLKMCKECDFKFLCQNEEFCFNKSFLCNVSSVFKEMFEMTEDDQNSVKLNDVNPQTLRVFQSIFLTNNIEMKNITKELCMFADKYDIQPLIKICVDFYETSLKKEYLIEAVEIAHLLNNDQLLRKVAEIWVLNREEFKENRELKIFLQRNPDCSAKLLQFLML